MEICICFIYAFNKYKKQLLQSDSTRNMDKHQIPITINIAGTHLRKMALHAISWIQDIVRFRYPGAYPDKNLTSARHS